MSQVFSSHLAPSWRLLQILPALEEGGVEQSAVEMALYLKEQGHVPFVASAGGKHVQTLEKAGIFHFQLPLNRKNPFAFLASVWRLARLVRQHKIQLIHARSRLPAWAGLWASKWVGVPFLTTFHGTHCITGRLKKFYNSVMVRGRYVIVNSKFVEQHVQEKYGVAPESIFLAPRGVDLTRFSPKLAKKDENLLKKELKIPPNTHFLLLPGRLTRWKGQNVLLEALGSDLLRNLPFVVALAGSPNSSKKDTYAEELKNLAKTLKIREKVYFLGSRDDLPALYTLADLTFSTSIRPEAFGRVAIESQACGTPVIATAHGGSLETILAERTGFLVPPNDPEALAQAIHKALKSSKGLQKMGQEGVKWVHENYSTKQTCEKEFQAYRAILG